MVAIIKYGFHANPISLPPPSSCDVGESKDQAYLNSLHSDPTMFVEHFSVDGEIPHPPLTMPCDHCNCHPLISKVFFTSRH